MADKKKMLKLGIHKNMGLQQKSTPRKKTETGAKYPSKPHGADGEYEHTAGGQTRLGSF